MGTESTKPVVKHDSNDRQAPGATEVEPGELSLEDLEQVAGGAGSSSILQPLSGSIRIKGLKKLASVL